MILSRLVQITLFALFLLITTSHPITASTLTKCGNSTDYYGSECQFDASMGVFEAEDSVLEANADSFHLTADPDQVATTKFTNPAQLRNSMLKSKWDCSGGICDAGFSFVKSFPRVVGNSTYPISITERDFGHSDSVTYIIGAASITLGLPLLFLILFILATSIFACGRCCCNCFGGRIATRKYTTARTWVQRLLIIVWAICVMILLFFAIGANHGLSKGINKSLDGVDEAMGFVNTALATVSTVKEPFASRLERLDLVKTGFEALPTSSSIQCYDGIYTPLTFTDGFEPAWLNPNQAASPSYDPCLANPSDQYCVDPSEDSTSVCATSSPTRYGSCDPCWKQNPYWRTQYKPESDLCTNPCPSSNPEGFYFPYSALCNPCDQSSPIYNSNDIYCRDTDNTHPCYSQWLVGVTDDRCNRCTKGKSQYFFHIYPGAEQCSPCNDLISPSTTGYCDVCRTNSKRFNAAGCTSKGGTQVNPCTAMENQPNQTTYTNADCDACNPEDTRYSEYNPSCSTYWLQPAQKIPNETKILQHLDLENRISSNNAATEALSGWSTISLASSALLTPFQDLKSHLTDHPSSNWVVDAASVGDSLNIQNWSISNQNLVENVFTPLSSLHATVSNTTAVAGSITPEQIDSLRFGANSTSIVTKPFLGKDWPLLITVFQSVISTTQCQSAITQISSLINELNNLVEFNSASSGSNLGVDLARNQQLSQDEVKPKFTFVSNMKPLITNYNSQSQSAWSSFSNIPLINSWRGVDFDKLAVVQKDVASISTILEQLITIVPPATLDTSSLQTAYSDFGANDGNVLTEFGDIQDTIESTFFTNACMSTFTTSLTAGNDWVTVALTEVQWLLDQLEKFNAINTDFSRSTGAGETVQQIVANISAVFDTIINGLNANNNAGTHVQNTADSYLQAYPTQAERNSLIALNTQFKSLNDQLTQLSVNTVVNYITTTQNPTQAAMSSLLDSGSSGIYTKWSTIGTAFDYLTGITQYTDSYTLLISVARSQIIAYLQAAKTMMGTCQTAVSVPSNENIPTADVIKMLQSMQTHSQSDSFPSQSTITAQINSYNNTLVILNSYSTTITPTLTTLLTSLQAFNLDILGSDADTVNLALTSTNPPTARSAGTTFSTGLVGLQTDTTYVNNNLTSLIDPIVPRLNTATTGNMVSGIADFLLNASAITSIAADDDSLHSPSHQTTAFPYSPFVAKPSAYLQDDNSVDPAVVGTKTMITGHVRLYNGVRDQSIGQIETAISSIEPRLDQIDDTVADLTRSLDTWSDYRTKAKRSGYVIDQTRLIIINVFIAIGLVIVFSLAVLALIKFHKLTMLCTMFLYPFVALSFLLAMIHMLPGLLVADGCNQKTQLFEIAVGGQTISASFTSGIVSYLSSQPAEPIAALDLLEYVYLCHDDQIPQIWQILRDAKASDLQLDDLTQVQTSLESMLGDRPITAKTADAINYLASISVELAEDANELYDEVQCSKTRPVFVRLIDKGICQSIAPSAATLGALFFFAAICIFPGLILGCQAFKVLNRRNHVDYKKHFVKQETANGTVIYAHEYVQGSGNDKGDIQHFKMDDAVGLEDDVQYNELKGFKTLKNHPTHNQLEMSQF